MSFIHRHRVRFSEVDAAGIVYFSRVFEIAHAAYEAFLTDRGMPLPQVIRDADWLLPVVHAEADYAAPMHLGDDIDVAVTAEPGGSSLRVRFRFTGSDGVLRATGLHVHAAVDRVAFRSRPLPDDLRLTMVTDGR